MPAALYSRGSGVWSALTIVRSLVRRKLSSAHSPRNGLWTRRYCQQAYYVPTNHARPLPRNPCTITWITTHLPTSEWWMAELAKARSMQPYIILYKTTLQLGVRNLIAQGFYTAATWRGIEPRIYDTLVRISTSKPPSHGYPLLCCRYGYKITCTRK